VSAQPVALPESAGALLTDADALARVQDAFAPPADARVAASIEIEIEVAGEGTFTLTYDDGALTGDEGMADEPFFSCESPKGAWPFVRTVLEQALAGFPRAPAIAARVATARGLSTSLQETALSGLTKLEGAACEIDVVGVGVFRIARGPLDEAVRKAKVAIAKDAILKLLDGAPLSSVGGVKVAGDTRLPGDVVAALGPVWIALSRER